MTLHVAAVLLARVSTRLRPNVAAINQSARVPPLTVVLLVAPIQLGYTTVELLEVVRFPDTSTV